MKIFQNKWLTNDSCRNVTIISRLLGENSLETFHNFPIPSMLVNENLFLTQILKYKVLKELST